MSDAMDKPARQGPSYWDYLRIEDLLSLQGGVEGDEKELSNHEVLFIVVHQVFELWFKLVLRELTQVRDLMNRPVVPDQDLSRVVGGLRRAREIVDRGVDHFRVMETLSTRDFLDFRDKLIPASGFQSAQFRELELLLGLSDDVRRHFGAEGAHMDALRNADGSESDALRRVMARAADRPTLKEAVGDWLWRTPVRGSSPDDPGDADVIRGFIDEFTGAHQAEIGDVNERANRQAGDAGDRDELADRYRSEMAEARSFLLAEDVEDTEQRQRRSRVRAALVFIESYRELPLLAWPREVVETLLAFEQSMVIFRQRHARMVEREIGRRVGTGGSSGVDYLDGTALTARIFDDVWAVRTILVAKAGIPPLAESEFYDFRFGG